MSRFDDNEGVTHINELREPGEGWGQQQQFQRVIAAIDDEDDRLVKLLRTMRMAVMPGMLSEDAWSWILTAAETVIDAESRDSDPEVE